ncbi:Bifunctional protein GlmU [bacterium HR32]|jgi:bifunctional UDP-N-acetylglucosamine pyrophosphorylase/glucosamine-1-phosphate N-acetyltransferase|nr:Bifunctional protein GlmU [bacterium HR32]
MVRSAAVVLAAGLGKRMRSSLPKVLHPLGGRPMLLRVLDALRAVVAGPVVVVVGHGADQVERVLPPGVRTARQVQPLGTGDALRCALQVLPEASGSVLVAYGDIPLVRPDTFRALLAAHQEGGFAATLAVAVVDDPTGLGRVLRDARGQFRRVVEEADCTPEERAVREVNTGLCCFELRALRQTLPQLRPNNAQGEYYLTDVFGLLQASGLRVGTVRLEEVRDVMGVNSRRELAAAEAELRRRTLERLMDLGVTVLDPATTYVAPEVEVGPDTVLLPFTVLEAGTAVGRECTVGPGAHVRGSRIGDRVRVWWSVVEESEVGDDCRIGPYAHLRPGTRLARRVVVGNFAELKNTTVGEDTRVQHVSYLGDATVGRGVNVGAGTVTCNFKYGVPGKHPTVIEDGAFIGSDTMLNAPVRVGAGAVTGAGSVVTKDIPPGMVAVGVPARVIRRARREDGTP